MENIKNIQGGKSNIDVTLVSNNYRGIVPPGTETQLTDHQVSWDAELRGHWMAKLIPHVRQWTERLLGCGGILHE